MLHTHEVAGSSPAPPTKPVLTSLSAISPVPEPDDKACAHLSDAVEAFLLSRRVANCSQHTLGLYARNLRRFTEAVGGRLEACTPLAVQRYLTSLREGLKPVSVHQHFRTLKPRFPI